MVAVVGGVEVDMLPFDGAPEALDEGVISSAAPAVAADAAAGGQQGLLVSQGGKLAALVGVEDVRSRSHPQGIGQGQQAKTHVERVGKLPVEHVARVPIEHGGQVEEALGHGHIRDVRAQSAAPAAPRLHLGPWPGGPVAGRDRA